MPEIERVAILGAGAMGAFFASKFFDAGGFSTTLIAGGERRERLLRDGLVINGQAYHIPIAHPQFTASPRSASRFRSRSPPPATCTSFPRSDKAASARR